MFMSIKRQYARLILVVTVVLVTSSVGLISIAQAAPVCGPAVSGC